MKRILAAGALCIFIVPIIFALYLGLSATPTIQEFGSAFVTAIPLGDVFYATVVSAMAKNAVAGGPLWTGLQMHKI